MRVVMIFGLAVLLQPGFGHAQTADKFHVTEAERAACNDDAARFCSDAYPDEDKLLVCMKAARPQLSEMCRTAFDAGVKRRHL